MTHSRRLSAFYTGLITHYRVQTFFPVFSPTFYAGFGFCQIRHSYSDKRGCYIKLFESHVKLLYPVRVVYIRCPVVQGQCDHGRIR